MNIKEILDDLMAGIFRGKMFATLVVENEKIPDPYDTWMQGKEHLEQQYPAEPVVFSITQGRFFSSLMVEVYYVEGECECECECECEDECKCE